MVQEIVYFVSKIAFSKKSEEGYLFLCHNRMQLVSVPRICSMSIAKRASITSSAPFFGILIVRKNFSLDCVSDNENTVPRRYNFSHLFLGQDNGQIVFGGRNWSYWIGNDNGWRPYGAGGRMTAIIIYPSPPQALPPNKSSSSLSPIILYNFTKFYPGNGDAASPPPYEYNMYYMVNHYG